MICLNGVIVGIAVFHEDAKKGLVKKVPVKGVWRGR